MIVFLLSSHPLLCCSSHLKHEHLYSQYHSEESALAQLLCYATINVIIAILQRISRLLKQQQHQQRHDAEDYRDL